MAPVNQQNENDYAIAKALQELEDHALAQAIAESQREELFRQQRQTQNRSRYFQQQPSTPMYLSAHSRQPKEDARYWSRHGEQLQPTYRSAHSQQQPPKPDSSQRHEKIEIEGRPAVTHHLINNYKNCKKYCDNCRRLMQKVSVLVTETEEWCRKDCEVTCYGEHFTRVFWSGARTNKMVVQMSAGEVHVSVTEKSWRMWFKNVAQKCWNSFKILGLKIVNKAANVMIKGAGPGLAIAGCVFTLIGC